MSVPKEKLYELIKLIPDDDNEEVVAYLENYIEKKKNKEEFDPVNYFGVLKDWDIDVEEECKTMREEWDHREWDSIT